MSTPDNMNDNHQTRPGRLAAGFAFSESRQCQTRHGHISAKKNLSAIVGAQKC